MSGARNPASQNDAQRAIARAITNATLPFAMATYVKSYLRKTPEYAAARAEGRAKAWLDRESESLGYALAEVIKARLDDLDD